MSRKFESFERTNSIREANGSFDSCNTCKRLVHSRLHELHEFKLPFVSRIEFIRSELSNCSAHVSGVCNRTTIVRDPQLYTRQISPFIKADYQQSSAEVVPEIQLSRYSLMHTYRLNAFFYRQRAAICALNLVIKDTD